MDVVDHCKVYFTDDVLGDAVTAPAAPTKIIEGRVALHQVLSCGYGRDVGPAAGRLVGEENNRAYYLCGSASTADVLLKFVTVPPAWGGQSRTFTFPCGGNGILFEDGVYLGKDQYAPVGGTTAAFDGTMTLSLFYTGGPTA